MHPDAAAPSSACSGPEADLNLLVHRAGLALRGLLDRACRQEGLTDGRDWLVLTALSDGTDRTQLELAHAIGIDKTTLTAVLDRLERAGMVVRQTHPADRRARIPAWTDAGRAAWTAVARGRGSLERTLLGDLPAEHVRHFREVLDHLAAAAGRTSTVC